MTTKQANSQSLRGVATPDRCQQYVGLLLANAPIIVWACDIDGTILVSEGKGLQAMGLKTGEAIGRNVFEMYAHVPQGMAAVRRALAGGESTDELHLDGVIVESYIAPLRDAAGDVCGVMGMCLDITVRKRMQVELIAAQNDLEQRVQKRTADLTLTLETLRKEITYRKKVEAELLEERRLMEQMLIAHERDRQLVAYDIHDGLVQDLTAAAMHAEAYWNEQAGPDEEPPPEAQQCLKLLRRSIDEARRMIGGLRPPILDEFGIVAAIEYLVGERQGVGDLAIEFQHEVYFDRVAPLLETAVFRIVQEALNNIQNHSQSSRAVVRLRHTETRIHLEIEDWGVGFDPAGVTEHRFGLRGIRERAHLLRGQAQVESSPGQGTRVAVELPITHAVQFARP